MTINGHLNDTHGYHIKPTNSMCSMISCFRLKGLCLSVRGKNNFLSAQSNFKYKNKKRYAKLRVALGVCLSICKMLANNYEIGFQR